MKIEMLGYLIIPLGLILACLENKYLLYTILIFIGFTGASIIKIGDLSIQPAYYLGGIFIIKQIIEILKNKRKIKINKFLIIFIIICICSVIMPKIIEGLNIEIINQNGKITNAKFTSHNITQLMYLIYCFIFFVVITDYLNQNKQERKNVINYMIKKRSGTIINISSIVGVIGNAGQVNYSASKAGIIGMTKSIAREVASRGITCNAIAPGFIETDMTAILKEDVVKQMTAQIPMKKLGQVEDIAQTAVFLAKSQYITGQVIHVNGGMAM